MQLEEEKGKLDVAARRADGGGPGDGGRRDAEQVAADKAAAAVAKVLTSPSVSLSRARSLSSQGCCPPPLSQPSRAHKLDHTQSAHPSELLDPAECWANCANRVS